jgi:N-acyl-L-homoserine lactone synthetase
MKFRTSSPEYIEKAMALTQEDAERIFARMRKKLSHRMEHHELPSLEAVALQLQFEDEQLKEWRDNFEVLRRKHAE